MHDRLITVADVCERLNISRAKLYRMMRNGEFPPPLKVGSQSVRWPQSELDEFLAELPRATGRKAAT